MRKVTLCGLALALTLAVASYAAAENEPAANKYVVAVAKLNLRAEPPPSGTQRMGGND